jgi:hypothetical protein
LATPFRLSFPVVQQVIFSFILQTAAKSKDAPSTSRSTYFSGGYYVFISIKPSSFFFAPSLILFFIGY